MKVSERALRAEIFGERETLRESLREIFRELEKNFKREHLGVINIQERVHKRASQRHPERESRDPERILESGLQTREVGNSKSIYFEVKGGGLGLEDPRPVGACCSMRIITYVRDLLFILHNYLLYKLNCILICRNHNK